MEFLFDNPLIIAILIGLITTFFGKKEERQEQRPKRPASPRQRGPAQQPAGRREPAQHRPQTQRQPAQQRPGRQPRPVPLERKPERPAASLPQLTDVQKLYEDRRRETLEPVRHEHRQEIKPAGMDGSKRQDKPVSLDLKPDSERLIEGIAWAQVLGAPRARNPHRTMRRR